MRDVLIAALAADVLDGAAWPGTECYASISIEPECLAPGWSYEASVLARGGGYAAPAVHLVGPGVRKLVALGRAMPVTPANATQFAGALIEALESVAPGDVIALACAGGGEGRKRRLC